MPRVGGVHYLRIEGLPVCATSGCRKRVERRGGSITSAFCLEHSRDAMHRLIEAGLAWHEARAQLWSERPRVRLTFVTNDCQACLHDASFHRGPDGHCLVQACPCTLHHPR